MLLRSGICSRIPRYWSLETSLGHRKRARSCTQYPSSVTSRSTAQADSVIKKESRKKTIFPKADLIILDGTNIAFWAVADWRRWKHLGATLEGCFKDWLDYLTAAFGLPQERFVVFDKPKGDGVILQRQLVNPRYLEKRQQRQGYTRQPPPGLLRSTMQLLWEDFSGYWLGREPPPKRKHRLWDAAWAADFKVVEAQGGWEADDAIAALCALIRERPGTQKKISVVSNDGDVFQLLDDRTTVTRSLSWYAAPSGFQTLEEVTARSFATKNRYAPEAFPLFLALKGKKESGVPGIAVMSEKSAAKLCAKVKGSDLDALENGQPLPPALLEGYEPRIKSSLSPGPRSRLEQVQRNLFQTRLSRGMESLPEGFKLATSQEVERAAARKAKGSLLQRGRHFLNGLLPWGSPLLADDSESAELPEFGAVEKAGKRGRQLKQASLPTLIWMQPYNRGRARYLRPHIEALSAFLTSHNISHRSWAVSADGLPIDLGITDMDGAADWHGLKRGSIFVVLGPGDYQEPIHAKTLEAMAADNSNDGRSRMQQLLDPSVGWRNISVLNGPTKMRVKELKKAGWLIYVIHHRLLESVLGYKAPRVKF